jgi:hypothetical protein
MLRFRLRWPAIVVERPDVGMGSARILPAGAEILTDDPMALAEGPVRDTRTMVAVEWKGERFSIFLADLLERAERL